MPKPQQAVPAALPRVPSLDGLPAMCGADDAALRHAAAAELLSAGEAALGAALHNSLSVDSLAASAGAAREGSHDSTNTAGGAAGGLTGALLVRAARAMGFSCALHHACAAWAPAAGAATGSSRNAGAAPQLPARRRRAEPSLRIADALAWMRHLHSRSA